jgi:hypothetical protein
MIPECTISCAKCTRNCANDYKDTCSKPIFLSGRQTTSSMKNTLYEMDASKTAFERLLDN